jgi:hypothetical protein
MRMRPACARKPDAAMAMLFKNSMLLPFSP